MDAFCSFNTERVLGTSLTYTRLWNGAFSMRMTTCTWTKLEMPQSFTYVSYKNTLVSCVPIVAQIVQTAVLASHIYESMSSMFAATDINVVPLWWQPHSDSSCLK